MKKGLFAFVAGAFLLVFHALPVGATHVTELTPTRELIPDVTLTDLDVDEETFVQRYALIHFSPDAKATLVLLIGGHGVLRLTEDSRFSERWMINVLSANFLVRARYLFGGEGFNVVLPDAATDFALSTRRRSNGSLRGLRGSRFSTEYLSDLEDLIADLRSRFGKPVWLVGTSRGTNGAASAAAQLPLPNDANSPFAGPDQPDGIVLTSSLTRGSFSTNFLSGVIDLSNITVPVMITSHEDDTCSVTPPEDTDLIVAALVNASQVKAKFFKGGSEPISDACNALSPHGYFGIEPKVVRKIGDWITEILEDADSGG